MSQRFNRVYLAGPMNGCSDEEMNGWRSKAKELLGDDYYVSDPTRRDYRGRELVQYKQLVEYDLKDIKDVDFVLVNAEKPSWGTAMEIAYATFMQKPIVAVCTQSQPSPWLLYHCHVVASVEDAVKWIWSERVSRRASGGF